MACCKLPRRYAPVHLCRALHIFFPFPPAVLRRELLVVGFGGGLRCEEQHHPHAVQEGCRGHPRAVGSRSGGGRAQGWPSNQTAETIISVKYWVLCVVIPTMVVLELHEQLLITLQYIVSVLLMLRHNTRRLLQRGGVSASGEVTIERALASNRGYCFGQGRLDEYMRRPCCLFAPHVWYMRETSWQQESRLFFRFGPSCSRMVKHTSR